MIAKKAEPTSGRVRNVTNPRVGRRPVERGKHRLDELCEIVLEHRQGASVRGRGRTVSPPPRDCGELPLPDLAGQPLPPPAEVGQRARGAAGRGEDLVEAAVHQLQRLLQVADLAAQLAAAGLATDDKLWRFPLSATYDKLIDSPIADMKNVGPRGGGSITAAQFIKRCVDEGVKWAHLDIAGMVWSDKPGPGYDKGATGYGVKLLDRFVADNFEK